MEISEIQEKINELINLIDDKTSCKHDNSLTIRHLIEEIRELANEVDKPDLRNEKIDIENLKEEIADVLILTTRLASNNNINIQEAILNKINKLKQRHNL